MKRRLKQFSRYDWRLQPPARSDYTPNSFEQYLANKIHTDETEPSDDEWPNKQNPPIPPKTNKQPPIWCDDTIETTHPPNPKSTRERTKPTYLQQPTDAKEERRPKKNGGRRRDLEETTEKNDAREEWRSPTRSRGDNVLRREPEETRDDDKTGGETTTTGSEKARAQASEEGECYGGAEKEISTHHPPPCLHRKSRFGYGGRKLSRKVCLG